MSCLESRVFRWALLLSVCAAGCDWGKPARIAPPKLDSQRIAEAVVAQLDTNQDGRLSPEECRASPALAAAFARYDTDQDGLLTADEIAARLQAMLDSRVGQMPCYCDVTLDGNPLADATVRLIPESYFGDALGVAEATTNYKGTARPQMLGASAGTPGVQFGLYRVEITHPSRPIPEQYNTETTLGMEVSPLERDGDSAVFALRST